MTKTRDTDGCVPRDTEWMIETNLNQDMRDYQKIYYLVGPGTVNIIIRPHRF